MKCLVSAHGLFPEVDHSSPHTPSFLLMGSMYVFPWWLSERMGSAFVTILVKNNLLEWHIWLVFCFFFFNVLFFFLFLFSLPVFCLYAVCLKFMVSSLVLHLQDFLMRNGRAFCFVCGIQSTHGGLDTILGSQYVHILIVSSNWLLPSLF